MVGSFTLLLLAQRRERGETPRNELAGLMVIGQLTEGEACAGPSQRTAQPRRPATQLVRHARSSWHVPVRRCNASGSTTAVLCCAEGQWPSPSRRGRSGPFRRQRPRRHLWRRSVLRPGTTSNACPSWSIQELPNGGQAFCPGRYFWRRPALRWPGDAPTDTAARHTRSMGSLVKISKDE